MASNTELVRNGEITESDATHVRFRERKPEEEVTCLSCGQKFTVKSNMEVVQHYKDIQHTDYYNDCLYCKGKVHRYTSRNSTIKVYHSCSRWRRGLDS